MGLFFHPTNLLVDALRAEYPAAVSAVMLPPGDGEPLSAAAALLHVLLVLPPHLLLLLPDLLQLHLQRLRQPHEVVLHGDAVVEVELEWVKKQLNHLHKSYI